MSGRPIDDFGCRNVAGSPARRRGNFLLSRQKKVTKEEALNRTRAPQARLAQGNDRMVIGTTRPAALSRLSLLPAPSVAASVRLTRGCTPGSPETQRQRRSGDATGAHLVGWGEHSEPQHRAHGALGFMSFTPTYTQTAPMERRPSDAVFSDESGVQPTLRGVKVRSVVLVIGTAARAQRVASAQDASGRFRAIAFAQRRSCAVQRLSFGDFSLAQQRKVTRPPGRNPGAMHRVERFSAKATDTTAAAAAAD